MLIVEAGDGDTGIHYTALSTFACVSKLNKKLRINIMITLRVSFTHTFFFFNIFLSLPFFTCKSKNKNKKKPYKNVERYSEL